MHQQTEQSESHVHCLKISAKPLIFTYADSSLVRPQQYTVEMQVNPFQILSIKIV